MVDALRRCAPIALIAGLLASPYAESARFGIEPLETKPLPRVVPLQLAQRIADARVAGFWIVDEGESLYRIARLLTRDESEAMSLERELAHANPGLAPAAAQLSIGSRIELPRALIVGVARARAPADSQSTPPVTAPAAAAPYVDRLIGGAVAESREDSPAQRDGDPSPGLRSWAVELRAESRDVSSLGRAGSQGVIARHAWETELYGDFALLLQAARIRRAAGEATGDRSGVQGTLFHDNFALSPSFVANSALGVVRPTLPPWLSTSYRVFLSSPLIGGASTVVSSPDREIRFAVGALGEYASVGVQQFERIPGTALTASYSERLGGEWLAGGTVVSIRGNDVTPDRSTLSLAAQQGFQSTLDGVKVQGAITDDGERAAWVDAQRRTGRLTQRFGAFQLDPDFRFGQTQSLRDTRGIYWRGDYRASGNFYSGGVEASQDNLRRDPSRGGNDSAGAFGNVVLRLDRNAQIGAGLSAREERPRTPTGVARGVYGGNIFYSRNTAFGTSRLDANLNVSRPDVGRAERYAVANWNQDWIVLPFLTLNSLLSYGDEVLSDRSVTRRTVSIAARGPAYGAVNWDASVTLVDARGDSFSERNYNTALSLEWSPAREWMVQLAWFRNLIQPGADNPLSPFRRENVVQLNLRYEDTYGASYPRVGGTAGRSGSGAVSGSVFYDENGDGRRQANERGAQGVVVVLDERQSATTDNDGRYKFSLVPNGRHRVRVLLERVALPWGLVDEAPREVEVDVRADARLDVPLSRIAP